MECKNAYKKAGIDYILCRKEKEPDGQNQREVSHAMCGHQAFCPTRSCNQLRPTWRNCDRLKANTPEKPTEATREKKESTEDKDKPKKKKPVKTADTPTGKIKNNII